MDYELLNAIGFNFNTWRIGNIFPALSGFNLEFLDGDHKLKFLTVGGSTISGLSDLSNYTLGMQDQSLFNEQPDIFRGWSKYLNLGADKVTSRVSGSFSGRGEGVIQIPPLDNEKLLVLRGFLIGKPTGSDHNIRKLGIRYFANRNNFQVTFRDDSPDDDVFSCTIYYSTVIYGGAGYNTRERFWGPFTEEFEFIERTIIQAFWITTSIECSNFLFTL